MADAGPRGRPQTCLQSGSIGVDDFEAEGVPQGRIREASQQKRTPLHEDEGTARGDSEPLGLLADGRNERRQELGVRMGGDDRGKACLNGSPRGPVDVEVMGIEQQAQEGGGSGRIEFYRRAERERGEGQSVGTARRRVGDGGAYDGVSAYR